MTWFRQFGWCRSTFFGVLTFVGNDISPKSTAENKGCVGRVSLVQLNNPLKYPVGVSPEYVLKNALKWLASEKPNSYTTLLTGIYCHFVK